MQDNNTLPTPYDEPEISGVREYGSGKSRYCEQFDDRDACFWSIYGHIPGEGLQCIGDFNTRHDAEQVYARITGRHYAQQAKA